MYHFYLLKTLKCLTEFLTMKQNCLFSHSFDSTQYAYQKLALHSTYIYARIMQKTAQAEVVFFKKLMIKQFQELRSST